MAEIKEISRAFGARVLDERNCFSTIHCFGTHLGTGVQDDSEAFQRAGAFLGVMPSTLYIPEGTYLLTHDVVMPECVTVIVARGAKLCRTAGATVSFLGTVHADGAIATSNSLPILVKGVDSAVLFNDFSTARRVGFATATTGFTSPEWKVGDVVWNTAPVIGGAAFWVAVANGSAIQWRAVNIT